MIEFVSLYQKEILWWIAVAMTLVADVLYIRDMIYWSTRPHIFSWIIRAILTWIWFFAAYTDWWWAGTRVLLVSAISCLIVIVLWWKQWIGYITTSDKISFGWALLSIWLRYLTKDPLLSVILVSCIDARTYFPTFRKWYVSPYDEHIPARFISWLKYVFAFFALENISIITVLYPASIIALNRSLVCMLIWRRRNIRKQLL